MHSVRTVLSAYLRRHPSELPKFPQSHTQAVQQLGAKRTKKHVELSARPALRDGIVTAPLP